MEQIVEKNIDSRMLEYVEGLYFRFKSLEMVIKLQYIPSQYVEIDNDTKEFYLEKFHTIRTEYMLAMKELKAHYFPYASDKDSMILDFDKKTATLTKHQCGCGGNCSL